MTAARSREIRCETAAHVLLHPSSVNDAHTSEATSGLLSRDHAIARLVQTHAGVCVHDLCRVLAAHLSLALPLSARLVLIERLRRSMRQVIDEEVTPYRPTGSDPHIEWLRRHRWPVTKATYVLAMYEGDARFELEPEIVAAVPAHLPGPLPQSRRDWVAQLHKDMGVR
jgi:hypothetical protein